MKKSRCNSDSVYDPEIEKFWAKFLKDYPGISQPLFYWMDAKKDVHGMQNMDLNYLKRDRQTIAVLVEGNCCVCPSKSRIEAKVKEFDLAINLLVKELKKRFPDLPAELCEKTTLYDLGYRNTWDIK